mgnify:CR=1 FL=1
MEYDVKKKEIFMAIQESGEMYLETILILSKSKDKVRAIDIADHMNYSKPSVSRGLGLLKDEGYISVDEGNNICLTEVGLKHAEKIYERHIGIGENLSDLLCDCFNYTYSHRITKLFI